MTGVTFAMYDFFNIAGPQLPTLTGVKFVSTDQFDWMQCIESHAPSYNFLFAPEPKLSFFPLVCSACAWRMTPMPHTVRVRVAHRRMAGPWPRLHPCR